MADVTNKFDVNGIINSIKSMINPAGNTPNPNPDDAIGVKIAQLSMLVQQLATAHAEQAKELSKVNKLLNELFKDIETLRNPPENKAETGETETKASSAEPPQSDD